MDVVVYALCKKYTQKKIAEIIEQLGTGIVYKGSVPTVADLPTPSTNVAGHLYTVLEDKSEYLCDGKQWINLGDTKIIRDVDELPTSDISEQVIYRLQSRNGFSYHVYKDGVWKELLTSLKTINGNTLNGEGNLLIDKVFVGLGNVDNTSDLDKPISTATQAALDKKVDKEDGKGLSSNDFTDTLKTKLDGISENANKVEASETNGNIKIDGVETTIYTEPSDTVHDSNYKHITVTDKSVSDGTNTFNQYDDTALSNKVATLENDVSVISSDYLKQADKTELQNNINNKVDIKVVGSDGTSLIFNESDGGGAQFQHNDGTLAFAGVNAGGKDGNNVVLYSYDKATGEGARLKGRNSGFYYFKGTNRTPTAADEIATVSDIKTYTADESTITLSSDNQFSVKEIAIDKVTNLQTTLDSKATTDALTAETTRATAAEESLNTNKLNKLPNVDDPSDPGYGYPYHIPYNFDVASDAEKATITLHTLTLDNNVTKMDFSKDLTSATTTSAGLMSAADKTSLEEVKTKEATWDAKQDALTAGDAIDLTSNKVSVKYDNDSITLNSSGQLTANGAKLTSEIVADYTVGGVPAGTKFEVGTSLETIIRQILCGVPKVLTSIAITTSPTKTSYTVGEKFSKAGMVVTAYYNNGDSKVITDYTYSPTRALELTDTQVTISYTESEVTKTATQAITVSEPVTSFDIYYGGAGDDDEQVDPEESDLTRMTKKTVEESDLLGQQFYKNYIITGSVSDDHGAYPAFVIPNDYKITAWSTDAEGQYPVGTIASVALSNNRTLYYASESPVYWPAPGESMYITVAKK